MMKYVILGIVGLGLIFAGCCSLTPSTQTQDEEQIVQEVADLKCGSNSLLAETRLDSMLGSESKWSGFSIKNNNGLYNTHIIWKLGSEQREYVFLYNKETKKVTPNNDRATSVLRNC